MPKPTFEHRHYKAIAAIIADMDRQIGYGDAVREFFANALRGTNPNYNRDRFIAAAKGEPSNGRDKVRS